MHMAYIFSSLLTRHTLHSGAHTGFPTLKQLYPCHGTYLAFRNSYSPFLRGLHGFQSPVIRTIRTAEPKKDTRLLFWMKGAAVAGVGLSLADLRNPVIHCDAPESQVKPNPAPVHSDERGPPPSSSVSVYELSFGTVAGVCAGVFMKKGAKALAFLFGGVFVLLQYLSSASMIRVDWGRVASKFENAFHTKDPKTGVSRPPNVVALWNWVINFLTADFQPRASFIAGFALGLRLG